ncbi:MAG: NTP transferase domain-containing protein [Chthonomonadales bacterium]|nr:NTP transferase domain-containing protein [Chthonomonadales bacterium]
MNSYRVPAIVMAGGAADPQFSSATGLRHRSLLRVQDPEAGPGSPTLTMLELAVRSLSKARRIADLYAVTDLDVPGSAHRIADHGGFVDNLFAGLESCRDASCACICTADMPFLTSHAVDRFMDMALQVDADLVYPIVRAEVCARAFPAMKRTSLATRQGRFTGGNMVLVRPAALLAARSHIEAAHAHRKSPLRLAMMLGLGVTVIVGLSVVTGAGLVSIGSLERAASRLIRATARALVSDDPAIATDVDRVEDVAAIRELQRSE